MASSDTDLINGGLVLLGEKPILALTQDDDVAKSALALWPQARDWVLAQHPWNRCVKMTPLTQTADTPLMTYGYTYLYPSDAIRLLIPDDDRSQWEVGSSDTGESVIWSNAQAPVVLKYIFRNTNVNTYSPWLSWVMSAWVALILAQTLTQHRGKVQDRMNYYNLILGQAKAMDGQEQSRVEFTSTDLTNDVRLGG